MSSSPLRLSAQLALALALGATSLVAAQPVRVKLETPTLEEGRSGTVRVMLSRGEGESRPVLIRVAQVELRQEGAPARRAGGNLVETIHGLSLESSGPDAIPGLSSAEDDDADRVVSVELRATDDPGAAARMPAPEHVSTVRGAPHRLVPVLARRPLSLDCQPLAGTVTVVVSWEAVVVPKETPEGIYALDRVQRWQPEEVPSSEGSGPRRVYRLTTRHWRAWQGERGGRVLQPEAAALLLRPQTLEKLPVYRGSVTRTFRVKPAPFGRKAASAQAGFEASRAWRLPDDSWILQRGTATEPSFALVGPKQEQAVLGRGDLSQIARVLMEGRPARLHWSTYRSHPDLAARFQESYEATYTKGRAMLTWAIDLDQLRPFLDEVLKAKLEVVGGSVFELRQP